MELGIAGRRALITGASRGLGRSIAAALASEGARVAVVARSGPDLATLVAQLGGGEAGHCAIAADLMPEGAPSQVLQELEHRFGVPEIVVHNVGGTLGVQGALAPPEDWRRVWRLNLEIAIEMNQVLLPAMQERRWGRVVHISSIAAARATGGVPYAAAKAALNAYVAGVGRAVAGDGVIVTAVMPGAILTEGGHWERAAQAEPDRVARLLAERVAVHRFARPEEVSDFVVFLCSERAALFAGAILPIDGGTW